MRVFQFMLPQEGHPSSKSKLVTIPSLDQEDSSPFTQLPWENPIPISQHISHIPQAFVISECLLFSVEGGKESYAIKLPIAITAVPDIRLKRAVGLGFKASPLMTCLRITPIV